MAIGFSNIPADIRVPLFYAEMDNSAANTAASAQVQAQPPAQPLAQAGVGDLLVAPTRIVLDGRLAVLGRDLAGRRTVQVEAVRRARQAAGQQMPSPRGVGVGLHGHLGGARLRAALSPSQSSGLDSGSGKSMVAACARSASLPRKTMVTTSAPRHRHMARNSRGGAALVHAEMVLLGLDPQRLVERGGLLAQFSCSSRVTAEQFHVTVNRAAARMVPGLGGSKHRSSGRPS